MSDHGERQELRIDAVIHAPARLQIVMQLFVIEAADATFLLGRTGLTWGNLSTHISKLEEAGYVAVEKRFEGKKPRTVTAHRPGANCLPELPIQNAGGPFRPDRLLKSKCRVDLGGYPPGPPTDPDVQNSRIRLFRRMGLLRDDRSSGRPWVAGA